MSVTFEKNKNIPDPERCFMCNKNLEYDDGVIQWCGAGILIAFHRNCASEFMIHLGSDLLKFKHEDRKRVKLY